MGDFPMKCPCCPGIVPSRAEWKRLAFVSITPMADYGLPDLEMRNHPCGNTLAMRLPLEPKVPMSMWNPDGDTLG